MIKIYACFRRLLILSFTILLSLSACNKLPPTEISLAAPQSAASSLVWITRQLGYFEQQGIKLELTAYPSGKRALAAMMQGKTDLAISAETPFVMASFQRDDLDLYATLGQSDNDVRILARKDRAISKPSDLVGKTIATQQGSAVHFFLSSFLLKHHIDVSSVTIRFLKVEQLAAALASAEVDAISMRDPVLANAIKLIGKEKLVEFSEPGLYTKTYNLVGFKKFTTTYPEAMTRILTALYKGAEYIQKNPQKAINMTALNMQVSSQRVAAQWQALRLDVTLNQSLLTTLQEEAQWIVSSGMVKMSQLDDGKLPDFWHRINAAPLTIAVPNAIGLIGKNQ